ncbi:LOW QUALITY PROTEIN: coiled-coil domain-containing protein 68 [Bufo gargarizans]|uniref:LOW QUALITY PROTEIN: coiled-coil domain-containing protein 68 n=1 Tax=Bufo gargarizans TaxID=30331 RepID=UPI001CF14C48|nr:LOW QUALITY PROTEIN: coiled-coil domain-containing protein 68 [Bufo gargarizans]
MTTISPSENGFMRKVDQGSPEDDIFYMYGSTTAHAKEETEYVRTIRATLEKIQNQLFKDDPYSKSTQEKNSSHMKQNGHSNEDEDSFGSRYKRILEKLKDQDLQIVDVHRDNEDLQIKLEATREAGSGAIRDATRKLYENYNKKSEQLRKSHEEEKQRLQVSAAENEDRFKKSIERLNEVADKIQEKHSRITELEKLMERMEAENASLVEKKRLLENKLSRRMGDPSNPNGCSSIQSEIFKTEEQINHLQELMMSQHQHLRALIQEREELKNRLKEQDVTIGELKEKIGFLECENKELKYKVDHWSSPSKLKVSKATSVSEPMFGNLSPYLMLLNHRKSPGSS